MKKMILLSLIVSMGLIACDKAAPEATADAPTANAEAKPEAAKDEAPGAAVADAKDAKAAPAKEEVVAVAVAIGQPAPAFELKDEAGKTHKLSDYKGKIVVLEWTRPDCPYVVRHYKEKTMETTYGKVGKDGVVWLAVDSSKTVEAADSAAWRKDQGFSYPVLQDKDGKIGHSYQAKTTPHMYVIDAEGVLQYSGAIDNNATGDEKEIVNYVEQAVTSLKEGKKVENSKTKPYGCGVKYAS